MQDRSDAMVEMLRPSEAQRQSAEALARAYGDYHHPKGLKDMLSEFDSSSNDFRNWKQQVDFLRDTYSFNDNTRVPISSRLKGKALNWFHSKPEHITLSAVNLMEEMKRSTIVPAR